MSASNSSPIFLSCMGIFMICSVIIPVITEHVIPILNNYIELTEYHVHILAMFISFMSLCFSYMKHLSFISRFIVSLLGQFALPFLATSFIDKYYLKIAPYNIFISGIFALFWGLHAVLHQSKLLGIMSGTSLTLSLILFSVCDNMVCNEYITTIFDINYYYIVRSSLFILITNYTIIKGLICPTSKFINPYNYWFVFSVIVYSFVNINILKSDINYAHGNKQFLFDFALSFIPIIYTTIFNFKELILINLITYISCLYHILFLMTNNNILIMTCGFIMILVNIIESLAHNKNHKKKHKN